MVAQRDRVVAALEKATRMETEHLKYRCFRRDTDSLETYINQKLQSASDDGTDVQVRGRSSYHTMYNYRIIMVTYTRRKEEEA